eukprot:7634881-Pyramimonas_sp.AAC.1
MGDVDHVLFCKELLSGASEAAKLPRGPRGTCRGRGPTCGRGNFVGDRSATRRTAVVNATTRFPSGYEIRSKLREVTGSDEKGGDAKRDERFFDSRLTQKRGDVECKRRAKTRRCRV